VNDKTDVYSFGVVLLELITGWRAFDTMLREQASLMTWVCAAVSDCECIKHYIYAKDDVYHSFIYELVLYPGFLAMEQIDLGAVDF
jgi:hypothetical protein